MSKGYSVMWPQMVSDLIGKFEYGLDHSGITDYFRLLDEYLDNQLDSNHIEEESDYIEPPPEAPEMPEENEIPVKDVEVTEMEGANDIHENLIDTDELGHYKQETSTVGVLEIKNPVHDRENQENGAPIKEASYTTYWWIGIGVALAIVVILIAIIARKRHSHRKQLQRQRRENSHA